MISAFSVPLASLIYPLLIAAAFWGIAVWALKQSDPVTPVVRALTGPDLSEQRDTGSAASGRGFGWPEK